MFYEKLKEERLKLSLDQQDLAKMVGVNKTTIQDWESGLALPDMDNAVKLSDVLNVSLDYLLKDKNNNSDFSYYTIHNDEEPKKISNRYHAGAFIFLFVSLLVLITLFLISIIEPITYEGVNRTYKGFLAYCISDYDFLAFAITTVLVLILAIIALILPEQKLRNIFNKKSDKK